MHNTSHNYWAVKPCWLLGSASLTARASSLKKRAKKKKLLLGPLKNLSSRATFEPSQLASCELGVQPQFNGSLLECSYHASLLSEGTICIDEDATPNDWTNQRTSKRIGILHWTICWLLAPAVLHAQVKGKLLDSAIVQIRLDTIMIISNARFQDSTKLTGKDVDQMQG